MKVDPKQAAPWPIPVGWTYSYIDGPGMERQVGSWVISIGDETGDGNGWTWWVTPVGESTSARRGCSVSMETAVFASVDALLERGLD